MALACALCAAALAQSVTITPGAVSVHIGTYTQFSSRVTGVADTGVAWSVALPPGGTGSAGSITSGGRYTPPAAMPAPNQVLVTVASVANPEAKATSTVTLENPFPAISALDPKTVEPGPFTVNISGTGFVRGADTYIDGVLAATEFVSDTLLLVKGEASTAQKGQRLSVAVKNPPPGGMVGVAASSITVGAAPCPAPRLTAAEASRFLDQAAFGPTPAEVERVQCLGLSAYIDEQLAATASDYPSPETTPYGIALVQSRFFTNAVHGEDQLRQRVAFALSQIFVVSALQESTSPQLVPYLRILQKGAFSNFRKLLEEVTLSPTMGEYLDMCNNAKANLALGTRANENYAREILQLFSIGLAKLNQDGTPQLDSAGRIVPSYDQTTIQNFAKVFTGWTYPRKPGATMRQYNPAFYEGPMEVFESNHDNTSKTLLDGATLPSLQPAAKDLADALDNIFNHANVAPFIGRRLIERLVKSNPSPEYVARVSAAFNDNGRGVRGDLAAVVRAILLDPEARQSGPTSGHLREPVVQLAATLRALNASVNDNNRLTSLGAALGQTVFAPATVFNYFVPSYEIPAQYTGGTKLAGAEFQIHSPAAAMARMNLVNTIVYGSLGAGAVIDFTPFASLAANPQAVATAIGDRFFHGRMPAEVNTELLNSMNAVTGSNAASLLARAKAALYVALSSSAYSVEH